MFRKIAILLCIAITTAVVAFPASKVPANVQAEYEEPETVEMNMVEEKPEFPGGDSAMYKFLAERINYPAEAAEDGVSGRVVVGFIIEKDGSISNVKIIRSKHPALDREAMRVVKLMPKWRPGKMNGSVVRVNYFLSVNFGMN